MQFCLEDFNACLSQPFTLEHNGASYALELISVDKLNGAATIDGREAFAIVFRADNGLLLDQQIYRMHHETLGDLELFIVPIGPDDKGSRYEAVFS